MFLNPFLCIKHQRFRLLKLASDLNTASTSSKTLDFLNWGANQFPMNNPMSWWPRYFNWYKIEATLLCFWKSNKATARSILRNSFIFSHNAFRISQGWSVWGRDNWHSKQITFSVPQRGFIQAGQSLGKKSDTKSPRLCIHIFFIEMRSRLFKIRKRLIFAKLCSNLRSLKK